MDLTLKELLIILSKKKKTFYSLILLALFAYPMYFYFNPNKSDNYLIFTNKIIDKSSSDYYFATYYFTFEFYTDNLYEYTSNKCAIFNPKVTIVVPLIPDIKCKITASKILNSNDKEDIHKNFKQTMLNAIDKLINHLKLDTFDFKKDEQSNFTNRELLISKLQTLKKNLPIYLIINNEPRKYNLTLHFFSFFLILFPYIFYIFIKSERP